MFDSDREDLMGDFCLKKKKDCHSFVVMVKCVCKNPVTHKISESDCQRNFRDFQAVNEQASISASCT